MDFSEVAAWAREYGIEAYSETAGCDSCIFVFSANCVPYREWLKNWLFLETEDMHVAPPTVDVPDVLEPCEDYRSD